MRQLAVFALLVAVAVPASAQPDLTEVVIPPASLVISPAALQPDGQISVDVSFRQGLAFVSIAGLGCFSPGATSSSPCDASRSLGISLWREDSKGMRATQPLVSSGVTFDPPPFYTLVKRTFSPIRVPRIQAGEYLTMELIFVDKFVKPEGGIRLTAADFPRVLGSRRFKWTCRASKPGIPPRCGYVEIKL